VLQAANSIVIITCTAFYLIFLSLVKGDIHIAGGILLQELQQSSQKHKFKCICNL